MAVLVFLEARFGVEQLIIPLNRLLGGESAAAPDLDSVAEKELVVGSAPVSAEREMVAGRALVLAERDLVDAAGR